MSKKTETKKEKKPKKAEKGLCSHCKHDPCQCGRPTAYGPEVLESAREYLGFHMPYTGPDREVEYIHTIEGLALHMNVGRRTLYTWIEEDDKLEFRHIFEKIMAKQGRSLVSGGISERFNSTITKVMMTKHGYRDSLETFNKDVPVDPREKEAGDKAVRDYLDKKKKK